jgi:DNA-binding NarL/FixJ family response regulator
MHEPAFAFGSFELCREVAAGITGAEFITVSGNSIAGRDHDEGVAAIARFLRADAPATASPAALPAGLTAREAQVLRLVATGSTNREIAQDLDVAVSTVERHLVNLYTKIGARNRADAIVYAVRHRIDRPM